ncbi:MAG: NADH-quinone oxidoreductase subunit C [Deltaproteobacteria bacterium]|nr:MAG: NADH-quinone oxidoreductase subunit C [Deltaproteobacteria bacterium]
MDEVASRLREKFPDAITNISSFGDELTVTIKKESILALSRFLKDEFSFDFLVDVCGVDYLGREPRFEVVYHLLSIRSRSRLRLKVPVPGESSTLDSVCSVWKAANWFEREVFDMYGISFNGHPDLRRILNTEDVGGYPLRKDFPLKGLKRE